MRVWQPRGGPDHKSMSVIFLLTVTGGFARYDPAENLLSDI